jgi:hypothetical protein
LTIKKRLNVGKHNALLVTPPLGERSSEEFHVCRAREKQ